jgi:hypothetical protein
MPTNAPIPRGEVDAGAFTTPWNAIQRYRKVDRGPLAEMACTETNDDHFHHNLAFARRCPVIRQGRVAPPS